MTETTMPPAVVPAQADEPSGGKAKLFVALGVVAALAVGGGGYLLLTGGEGEDTFVVPSSQRAPGKAVKPATKVVAKKPTTVPVVTSAVLGRDPFKPLYIQPVTPVAPVAPVSPVAPIAPVAPAAPASGGTTSSGSTTAPKSYAMTLKRVYGSGSNQTAEFVISGKTMLAKVGSVFGPTSELKLLSLGQNSKGVWLATVQVGDSDPFDAVQGQKVYVQ